MIVIQASVPIEFFIECRTESLNSIGESALADYISKTFGAVLRFFPKIDGVNCQVNIRGQQDCLALLKRAVAYLSHITQTLVKFFPQIYVFTSLRLMVVLMYIFIGFSPLALLFVT